MFSLTKRGTWICLWEDKGERGKYVFVPYVVMLIVRGDTVHSEGICTDYRGHYGVRIHIVTSGAELGMAHEAVQRPQTTSYSSNGYDVNSHDVLTAMDVSANDEITYNSLYLSPKDRRNGFSLHGYLTS